MDSEADVKTIVLVTVAGALVLCVLLLARIRVQVKRRNAKRIPRAYMPLNYDILPKLQQSFVTRSEVGPDPSTSVQEGWGAPGSQYENMHFKTTIAWSAVVLGLVAERRGHPSFAQSQCRTMREYLRFMKERVPGLKESVCERYCVCYEEARFGTSEFDEETFREFMINFLVLCQEVETAPPPTMV